MSIVKYDVRVCSPESVNVGCKSRPKINNLCLLTLTVEQKIGKTFCQ